MKKKKKLTQDQQWFADRMDEAVYGVLKKDIEKRKKLDNIEKLRKKL